MHSRKLIVCLIIAIFLGIFSAKDVMAISQSVGVESLTTTALRHVITRLPISPSRELIGAADVSLTRAFTALAGVAILGSNPGKTTVDAGSIGVVLSGLHVSAPSAVKYLPETSTAESLMQEFRLSLINFIDVCVGEGVDHTTAYLIFMNELRSFAKEFTNTVWFGHKKTKTVRVTEEKAFIDPIWPGGFNPFGPGSGPEAIFGPSTFSPSTFMGTETVTRKVTVPNPLPFVPYLQAATMTLLSVTEAMNLDQLGSPSIAANIGGNIGKMKGAFHKQQLSELAATGRYDFLAKDPDRVKSSEWDRIRGLANNDVQDLKAMVLARSDGASPSYLKTQMQRAHYPSINAGYVNTVATMARAVSMLSRRDRAVADPQLAAARAALRAFGGEFGMIIPHPEDLLNQDWWDRVIEAFPSWALLNPAPSPEAVKVLSEEVF